MKSIDQKILSRFFSYSRNYWKWILASLLAIPVSTAGSMLFPWLIIRIVDDYLIPKKPEGLYWIIFLMGLILVVTYLADAVYSFSLQRTGHSTILDMRRDLFSHTLKLPRKYFDKNPIGATLTRITSDMESLGESMATGVLGMISDVIKTIALTIFLFYLNWKLTLAVFVVTPVIFLVIRYLRRRLRDVYNLTRLALSESTGFLQECLNGIKTVQLYSAEPEVQEKYESKTTKFYQAQIRSNIYDATLYSIIEGITSITVGLLIWYGSGQVLEGIVTIGVLIGFLNTLNRIFIPIREFTQQISVIQRAMAALENIEKLFQEPIEEESKEEENFPTENFKKLREIQFQDVYFRYREDGPEILNGISFSMKRGDRIALVGSTGSGKSTIIKILTKAYGNYRGSIKVNGVELSQIPQNILNQLVSLMQQDVYLFNESLDFNISLKRKGLGPVEVQRAAEYVYAHSFIQKLPEEYQFQVKDNGKNLSSGQAQLVSFARAIAGNSEIIMLDEATSAVDSVTESWIQKAIERIFQEKTVIAIAHRLSTVQNSDLILVLEEGSIMERGNHHELLAMDGIYAKLVNSMETEIEN